MRAHIVGLGLIGGSIGIALRRAGWHVAYTDPNVPPEEALAMDAADERSDADADVTIIATPVDDALALVRHERRLTTTVCSVMQPLRAASAGRFVAGHPLAGSAERGLRAASGDLFRGKPWFVDAEEPVVDRVIADCGAKRELVPAGEHDAAMALTSHLPQILSTALAAYLEGQGIDMRFAGSGLATFLRLAQSDASVWRPVIDANRQNIEPHLDALVATAKRIIESDDEAFEKAHRFLQRLSVRS